MLEHKSMDVDLWPQPSPAGVIRFFSQVNFSSGVNIRFPLNWSDQLHPDLNWSPGSARSLNRLSLRLLFLSCLDRVINSWMTAHCKFLMRDFEIRKGGKQLQFMAWSSSKSRDLPEKPALESQRLLRIASSPLMEAQSVNPISAPRLFPEKFHATSHWFSGYGMWILKWSRKH